MRWCVGGFDLVYAAGSGNRLQSAGSADNTGNDRSLSDLDLL
jgi:hypothetical protein